MKCNILCWHILLALIALILFDVDDADGNAVNNLLFKKHQPGNRKEVFVFSTTRENYKQYDWSKITTFAECNYHDAELLKFAHSKNVTVVYLTTFNSSILYSRVEIERWIEEHVQYAIVNGLDGINVDYENDMSCNDTQAIQGYNYLMQRLVKRFKAAIANAQVTIDVPYAPGQVYRRCYDYKTLGETVDFSFLMMYDEPRPYRFSAWANSGYNATSYGLKKYKELGIPGSKLLLGVPWYGYEYVCTNFDEKQNRCWTAYPPQEAAKGYSAIRHMMKDLKIAQPSWDKDARSPYFSYKLGNSTMRQVWFDNPLSLSIKYDLAEREGLRGVGMWEADSLDYRDTSEMRHYVHEMWAALP